MDDVIQTKRCSKCGRILPLGEFAKNKTRKDSLANWCKQCNKAYKATYRQANKDAIQKWRAEYYQAHKDEKKAYDAEYYDPQKNPMGWAKSMVKNYKNMDRERGFDDSKTITAEWFVQNIMYKSCAHCGLLKVGLIGCNRLDNSKGHTIDNVEPCCFKCNCKENNRDQIARGIHISQIRKKQSFKDFVDEHKAKHKNLT